MRLTAIKLAGFKSFVEPTILTLPSSLTAVVGPNGSGKSNLIDAVRWVLGENSAKTLRGADSDDVIFNGSHARKPGGRASVELLFDNADHGLQGAYAGYAEIAVRREVVRGEGSQYFLNGQKCLKRDVVDLFLGTGLGGRNQYAILEQGTIARLVEARPEDLRLWLEEVAGISRYKERRRETESRVRQTRENLERLHDLEQEIGKRLEVLAKQAEAAGRYQQLKQLERRLRAEILLLRRRQLTERSEQLRLRVAEAEHRLARARATRQSLEQRRLAGAAEQRGAGDRLNTLQGALYQAEAALAKQEQGLAHAREMRDLRVRELRQVQTRVEQAETQLGDVERRRGALRQSAEDARAKAHDAADHEQALTRTMQEGEAQLAEVETQWEAFNQRAQKPLLDAEGQRARVQALERLVQQNDERLHRLELERGGLSTESATTALADADAALQSLEADLGQAQGAVQALETELTSLREQRSRADEQLHEVRRALEDARGRRASLETLQQAALRQDDGEVSNWLSQHGWDDRPQLASVVRVEPGWEAAVEHVLGGLLQAPLIHPWPPAELPAQGPPHGLVLAAGHPERQAPDAQTLADCVEGPIVLQEWLRDVHRAVDAAAAVAVLSQLQPGQSVITADGVWYGHGWVRYPRTDAEHSGVIARGQLLRELQQQSSRLEDALGQAETRLQAVAETARQLEEERRAAVARQEQARSRHARLLAERQAQTVRLEQLQQRIATLERELRELRDQRRRQGEELAACRQQLADLERTAEQLRAERAELQQRLVDRRDQLQRRRSALQSAAHQRSQAEIRQAAQESELRASEQALEALLASVQHLRAQYAEGAASENALDAPLHAQEVAIEGARAEVELARARLSEAREAANAADAAMHAAQHALQAAEVERDAAAEQLQQARLEFETCRGHDQALEAQLAVAGEPLEQLAAELDASATAEAWEQKLAMTQRRIDRLGAINLAAIQELDEQRERATYLDAQRQDLEQALATLEEAMHKLDRETKALFRDTFERVDVLFRDRCPKLFGGGEAWLEMIGEDWLTAGVRVMTRPPGKRNSTIQSLSGGEKSLAALALLFALFDLNPAPFCLLDEVEAPLDDANVHRFVELVREMSQRVQFIIITHNKITMELAAHLHGVTMQEPGVSRLVSVDVQQAVGFIDSTAVTAEV